MLCGPFYRRYSIMGIGFVFYVFVIVAAMTIFRHIDKKKLREGLLRIPVVGKVVLVIFGCLKKVIKLMWGTIVWFFGWVFGLPVFSVLIKCAKRIWTAICKFAGEESSVS